MVRAAVSIEISVEFGRGRGTVGPEVSYSARQSCYGAGGGIPASGEADNFAFYAILLFRES